MPAVLPPRKYEPPTEEEVAWVLAYWAEVEALVHRGTPLGVSTPPSALLARVGEYQRRQATLLCSHPTLTLQYGEEPRCGDCDRPVRVMSDLQIEELTQ